MKSSTEIEFKELLDELEKNPTDLDLINSVAIGYFENYNQKIDKEDYDYFEKAYNLKRTVKSTHNFAWFLYFEWSEIEWRWKQDIAIEKALRIQKECIELNPKSNSPYYQYGYMLLDQKRFDEAIKFLEQANKIENQREITHNIGFCHFQLGDYQSAFNIFKDATTNKDLENRSQFNLALAAFKTNKLEQVKSIAKKLKSEIETNIHETISSYEIGLLFFLLKEYSTSAKCLLKQGINGIDLLDWPELSFALFISDKETWKIQLHKSNKERAEWITEIENRHEDWDEYSKEEKHERLIELKEEIKTRQEILSSGLSKPIPNLSESLLIEYCGCLLFDCTQHGNKKDDN